MIVMYRNRFIHSKKIIFKKSKLLNSTETYKEQSNLAAMENSPSQWQLKYKTSPFQHRSERNIDQVDDDLSFDAWIAKTQESADAFISNSLDYDYGSREIADVIARMEVILGVGAQHDNHIEYTNLDDSHTFDELSSRAYTSMSIQEIGSQHSPFKPDKLSFNNEQMIKLYMKNRNEKISRKCLRILAIQCAVGKRREARSVAIIRKRRRGIVMGRSFLHWKDHYRLMKLKQNSQILKFGRSVSKKFRRVFSAWKELSTTRQGVEREVMDKVRLVTLSHGFFVWRQMTNQSMKKCMVSF